MTSTTVTWNCKAITQEPQITGTLRSWEEAKSENWFQVPTNLPVERFVKPVAYAGTTVDYTVSTNCHWFTLYLLLHQQFLLVKLALAVTVFVLLQGAPVFIIAAACSSLRIMPLAGLPNVRWWSFMPLFGALISTQTGMIEEDFLDNLNRVAFQTSDFAAQAAYSAMIGANLGEHRELQDPERAETSLEQAQAEVLGVELNLTIEEVGYLRRSLDAGMPMPCAMCDLEVANGEIISYSGSVTSTALLDMSAERPEGALEPDPQCFDRFLEKYGDEPVEAPLNPR